MKLHGFWMLCLFTVHAVAAESSWSPGPYLLLDDALIAGQSGVQRRVHQPSRLPDPIVTGYEDGCFQPYVTVIRDPLSRRFRMWYGEPATPQNTSETRLAYLASGDGIHWERPHRILATPPIQFGASVLDEGPGFADASRRFKFAWWKNGGLQIATSPDGFTWTALSTEPVVRANHDITGIDWDPIRKRYLGLLSAVPSDGPYKGLRIPHQSVSDDLLHWKEPWPIVTPDANAAIEKGETQFYGMSAVLARGDLLVSMVKVLRDDLNCEPDKTAAELHDPSRPFAGIGYTVIAWSRDGEHWKRETQPFLDRNPTSGTWDRAMAWADDQMVVNDYTYIYYGGYRWGHKAERFTERQIGFAHMLRDRYVGYTAGKNLGVLRTKAALLAATSTLTVNAHVEPTQGELRVRLLDESGKPYPGFDWDDTQPIKGDRVNHSAAWKADLSTLAGKPVAFEFRLTQASLYSFELK
jgi:hypothetical protein